MAEVVGKYHLLAWLTLYSIIIFCHGKENGLQMRMCGMDRFVLDHLSPEAYGHCG